ncbi:hypothetical protein [Homoserinimonas sp. A520]
MTTPGSAAASVTPAKATKKPLFSRSEGPTRPPLPQAHRKAAFISGPLSLVITNIGLLTLVLPLAIWYAIVVLKNLFVGLVGLTGGEKAAADVNETSKAISLSGLEGFGIAMVIVGTLLAVAGIVVSVRILSKAGVHRAWSVTFSSVGASVLILGVLMMIVWAVGGLLFSVNTQSVGELVSNAVLAFAAYGLLNVALAAAIGGLVWWWMAHLFRSADGPATPATDDRTTASKVTSKTQTRGTP